MRRRVRVLVGAVALCLLTGTNKGAASYGGHLGRPLSKLLRYICANSEPQSLHKCTAATSKDCCYIEACMFVLFVSFSHYSISL